MRVLLLLIELKRVVNMSKIRTIYLYLGITILIIICFLLGGRFMEQSKILSSNQSPQITDIQEEQTFLIDSVYTIEAPFDTIEFDTIYLFQYIAYCLNISLASPHSCEVNISLIDPDLSSYDINERKLEWGYSGAEYIIFSFGTAMAGNYSLILSFVAEYNLNVHLCFFSKNGCFEEVIRKNEIETLLFYRITKFTSTSAYIEHNIWLNTEVDYQFFMGRVTPYIKENGVPLSINYSIVDPRGIEFRIYDSFNLTSDIQLYTFHFQTALPGLHVIRLEVLSKIPVNIGYYVIFSESSEQTNEPQTLPSINSMGNFYVPIQIVFYLSLFLSLILISLLYLLKIHQRKSSTKF